MLCPPVFLVNPQFTGICIQRNTESDLRSGNVAGESIRLSRRRAKMWSKNKGLQSFTRCLVELILPNHVFSTSEVTRLDLLSLLHSAEDSP